LYWTQAVVVAAAAEVLDVEQTQSMTASKDDFGAQVDSQQEEQREMLGKYEKTAVYLVRRSSMIVCVIAGDDGSFAVYYSC
jgi:hypothetical protein